MTAMALRELDSTSMVEELQKDVLPRLSNTWGFHSGFIARIQVPYLLHVIKTGHLKSSKKRPLWQSKIPLKEVIRFMKIFFLMFRWRYRYKHTYSNEVVIAGYAQHQYYIRGEKINLYTDPVGKRLTELNLNTLPFFFDAIVDHNAKSIALYQYYKYLLFFHEVMLKLHSQFSMAGKSQLIKLKENERILNTWLTAKGCKEADQISSIVANAVIRNEIVFRVFDHICKMIQPKFVWTYCFYDNDTSAFSRAARKNNIRFIDYQHSQQSDTHFVYSRWLNIDSFIDFFPSTFWVWRKEDKERIFRNFTGDVYKPEVILGGNIYLSLKENILYQEKPKGSILVSLQGQWIPDFLEDFVKSENSFLWYFRLHPRYPGDKEKLLKLKSECGDKIEIDEANNLSLYDVFTKVTFNITAYSGVAIEANEFGIKNIIYSEKGYITFHSYIDKKVFEFVTDKDSLRFALDNPYINGRSDSTIMSDDSIVNNLNRLLQGNLR